MVFKDAFRLYSQTVPPARFYVHDSSSLAIGEESKAAVVALERLIVEDHSPQALSPSTMQFFLGFLWENREDGASMIDLLGYGDFKEWKGNPSVFSWNLRNGVYVSRWPGFVCEEELILAGKESELRRTTPDLSAYLRSNFIGFPPTGGD